MLSNQSRPSYNSMRGYGSIHANNYSGGPSGGTNNANNRNYGGDGPGRPLERRPSKLDQMRADYQKKILKEKEEKMVNMYEENQRKAMGRVQRAGGSGYANGHTSNGNNMNNANNGGTSVRDFFNERRRMEQSGAAVPPIDNHYRQAKGYSSPGAWSNRTGSGNSTHKSSAGRDRSQPLAPIRRPTDTQETSNGVVSSNGNNSSGRSGIPQRQQNGYAAAHAQQEENPFRSRPAFVKHKPLPPPSAARQDDDGNVIAPPPSQYNKQSNLPKYSPPQNRRPPPGQRKPQPPPQQQQQPPQQRPQPQQRRIPQPTQQPQGAGGPQKLTDFQKWQLEQNQARENRLRKLNHNVPAEVEGEEEEDDGEEGGYWGHPSARDSSRSRRKPSPSRSREVSAAPAVKSSLNKVEFSYESEEEEGVGEDEVARLERELLEKIAREQAELERIKVERQKQEEQEKKELEQQKKREAAERARRKKIEEDQRKEEERERQRREKEEEKMRKEDEKRRKEEDKLNAKRQKEEEKRRKEELKQEEKWRREEEKMKREEEKRMANMRQSVSVSPRKGDYYGEEEESEEEYRSPSPGDTYVVSKSSRNTSSQRQAVAQDEFEEQPVAAAGSGAEYYAQMARSSDAKGSVGSLQRCKNCGRKFAQDRLQKHQSACKQISKPRKEFNMAKKRVEGTEMAKYVGKSKREPPKKKNNWRTQHEQFIESLRYAKKATEYEKQGKDLRELGPPPAAVNPDLVPCPTCGRKFNETAAERHIPRCKDLKTKPARMKR